VQLHQIPSPKNQKSAKRIGRGGKRGTYSGKGVKGQKSRAGRKLRPEWRDMLKSIPKRRGYKFKSIQTKPVILNLADLNKFFKDGEVVSITTLSKKGLVTRVKGRMPEVKILGKGELSRKLSIKGLSVSKSVSEAIKKVSGTIK